MFAPMAPYVAEEFWSRPGHDGGINRVAFPQADEKWLVDDEVEVPVQVNGKVKAGLKVDVDISEEDIRKLALADERIAALIEGKELKKFLYIPSRMVTIAAKRQPAEALSLGTQLVPFVKALSRRYHGRPALRKRRPQVWARNISPT